MSKTEKLTGHYKFLDEDLKDYRLTINNRLFRLSYTDDAGRNRRPREIKINKQRKQYNFKREGRVYWKFLYELQENAVLDNNPVTVTIRSNAKR